MGLTARWINWNAGLVWIWIKILLARYGICSMNVELCLHKCPKKIGTRDRTTLDTVKRLIMRLLPPLV